MAIVPCGQVMERRQAAAEEAEEQNSEGSGRDGRTHQKGAGQRMYVVVIDDIML